MFARNSTVSWLELASGRGGNMIEEEMPRRTEAIDAVATYCLFDEGGSK
jgi:hypothetical protein